MAKFIGNADNTATNKCNLTQHAWDMVVDLLATLKEHNKSEQEAHYHINIVVLSQISNKCVELDIDPTGSID